MTLKRRHSGSVCHSRPFICSILDCTTIISLWSGMHSHSFVRWYGRFMAEKLMFEIIASSHDEASADQIGFASAPDLSYFLHRLRGRMSRNGVRSQFSSKSPGSRWGGYHGTLRWPSVHPPDHALSLFEKRVVGAGACRHRGGGAECRKTRGPAFVEYRAIAGLEIQAVEFRQDAFG